MKNYLLLVFSLMLTSLLFSQSSFKKNDIFLEAGGNGLFGSVNYERQLTPQPGLGARIGIGFYSENAYYHTIPVGINYLFKLNNDRSFIDAGLGITWTRLSAGIFGSSKYHDGSNFSNFIPSIGYRRQTDKNIMWRISLTPAINNYGFVPWLGISIGKMF